MGERLVHAVNGVLVPCTLSGSPIEPCPHCGSAPRPTATPTTVTPEERAEWRADAKAKVDGDNHRLRRAARRILRLLDALDAECTCLDPVEQAMAWAVERNPTRESAELQQTIASPSPHGATMPTADPTLATLARLVDHERWTLERYDCGHDGPDVSVPDRHEGSGILWRWLPDPGRWLPDPDDAATGGVLVGLLPPGSEALRLSDFWRVLLPGHGYFRGPTLGRACVPAIAVAWNII